MSGRVYRCSRPLSRGLFSLHLLPYYLFKSNTSTQHLASGICAANLRLAHSYISLLLRLLYNVNSSLVMPGKVIKC